MIPTSRAILFAFLLALGWLSMLAPCSAEVAMAIQVQIVPVSPSAPVLAAASDTGVSNSDGITQITSPTVIGTTSPNADMSIYISGVVVGTGTADGAGNYSVVIGPLAIGTHVMTAIAAYGVGFSAPSAPTTIQIVPASIPTASFAVTYQRVSEGAGAVSATIDLSAASDLSIQIPFSIGGAATVGSDYTTASVSPLVIPPGTASVAVAFTVIDDALIETTETIAVAMGAPTNATVGANALHTILINDNDTVPAIVVTPSTLLTVSESGTSAAFFVKLASVPSGNVTVNITNPSATSLSLSTSSLTFTPTDFDIIQLVLVTGVSDGVTDGDQTYLVPLAPVVAGTNYDGVTATPVSVEVLDEDIPALLISESAGSTVVAEGGTPDDYTVALATPPSGPVTVTLVPDARLSLDFTTLNFTTLNWNIPQPISVTAIDDAIVQGNSIVSIVHTASGGGYDSMADALVSVAITDNDSGGAVSPSVMLLPSSQIAFTEGDPDTLIATGGLVSNPIASLSGARLALNVTGGDAADVLAIQSGGNITQSGTTVSYSGTPMGIFVASGANLTITFNATATTAMVQELLRRVVYRNVSDDPSAALRTIRAVLTNSANVASPLSTRTLAMTPVNDAPQAAPLVLVAVDSVTATPAIIDPDGPSLTVTVQTAPTKGTLVINDAATGRFTYQRTVGQNGTDSFVLAITDGAAPTPGTTTMNVTVALSTPASLPRPWIDSRPPVEGQAGDLLQWTMHVDTTDLAGPALTFTTIGAPAGLTLVPDLPTDSATLSWTLPLAPAGEEVSFIVLVTDSVSSTAAAQVVTIFVHPQPGSAQ